MRIISTPRSTPSQNLAIMHITVEIHSTPEFPASADVSYTDFS